MRLNTPKYKNVYDNKCNFVSKLRPKSTDILRFREFVLILFRRLEPCEQNPLSA